MKKFLLVVSIILMACIVFSACSTGNVGSTADSTSAAPPVSQGNTEVQTSPSSTPESVQGVGNVSDWAQYPVGGLVPEPQSVIAEIVTNTEEDFIAMMDWSRDEAVAYAETVKAAGFDQGPFIIDEEESYSYQAVNKDGTYIFVSSLLEDGVRRNEIIVSTTNYNWLEKVV
jgi:hypothetical protein